MAQTELHRHLDVSFRMTTLLELAQARGLEGSSTSVEAFRDKVVLAQPLASLEEVLAQFTLFQKVLDRPEVLERVAFEAVEDCYREGTRKVELRFGLSFITEFNAMNWGDVIDSFHRGMNRALSRYPDMKAGLLCIASRNYGVEACEQTVDFFLQNRTKFVGLDLAGDEKDWPSRLFEKPFTRAKNAGARITVHAGEGAGPENIWEAIELCHAERIGHGLACERDPALMKALAEKKTCLEMCPTSNWLTRATPRLEDHPLPRVLRAGIPVSINTDDPAIFGCDLPGEARICREKMGMSEAEIQACFAHADRASFL